jgi:hypothetical protein
MPVEDEALKERTAKHHDQPIPVKRGRLSWSGDVIEVGDTIANPAPQRLHAVSEEQKELPNAEFANVSQLFGKPDVDVITGNVLAESLCGHIRLRRDGRAPLSMVAPEACQHQLHHETLSMIRRRRMSENEQLHWGGGLAGHVGYSADSTRDLP